MKTCRSGFLFLALLGFSPAFAELINVPDLQARAAKDDALAEYQLGRAYQMGDEGVPKDFAKAAELYRKSAAQGNAKAMFNLGYMYHFAQGVAQDDKATQEWFQKAADKGLPAAEFQVGLANFRGENGVKKDSNQAAKWFLLAAQPSSPPEVSAPAANALAYLFETGDGVKEDPKQAVFWYTEAANAGFVKGQANLGRVYEIGSLVNRDPAQAYMWLKIATYKNDPMAQHIMSEALAGDAFTAEQKAEGDRLADEYQAKHNLPPLKGPMPIVMTPGMREMAKAKAAAPKKIVPVTVAPANPAAPVTAGAPAANASVVAPGVSAGQ